MSIPLQLLALCIGFLRGIVAACRFRRDSFDVATIIGEESFGHKITTLDYFARLFQGNSLFVFWFPLTKTNPYLLRYYADYLTIQTIEPCRLWLGSAVGASSELKGLRLGLSFAFGLSRFRGFLPDATLLYKSLNRSPKMKVFGVWEGDSRTYETFYSHDVLLRDFPLPKLGAQIPEWKDFEQRLSAATGKPVTKFVSILLRKDAALHKTAHDKLRDAGDLATYQSSVEYLSSKGYTVLIAGVDKWESVEKLPGVYLIHRLPLDQTLTNFAMLTRSTFLLCQHSGPVHLANIAGVPLIIADFLPLWQGSAGPRDLFLPKTFFHPRESRTVPLKEIFTRYPRLFFGDYSLLGELELRDARAEDIKDAVIEMEQELANPGSAMKDPVLAAARDAYLASLPKPSLHHMRNNRVSRSILLREFISRS